VEQRIEKLLEEKKKALAQISKLEEQLARSQDLPIPKGLPRRLVLKKSLVGESYSFAFFFLEDEWEDSFLLKRINYLKVFLFVNFHSKRKEKERERETFLIRLGRGPVRRTNIDLWGKNFA